MKDRSKTKLDPIYFKIWKEINLMSLPDSGLPLQFYRNWYMSWEAFIEFSKLEKKYGLWD